MAEGKAAFHAQTLHERILDKKRLKSGKLGSTDQGTQPQQLPDQPNRCPECGSLQLYKDGLRYTTQGPVQRFLCRSCGYRFSQSSIKLDVHGQIFEALDSGKNNHKQRIVTLDSTVKEAPDNLPLSRGEDVRAHHLTIIEKGLNALPYSNSNRQVCETLTRGSKNLSATETRTVAGEMGIQQEAKGKILEYAWRMKKRGQAETTIKSRIYRLNVLVRRGANLNDPDSVETILATEHWTPANKRFFVMAYLSFARAFGIQWIPIRITCEPKQAYIPLESEIDQLIAGCGKVTATVLQILKDTGCRIGELCKLKWTDVNQANSTISINNPEKGSRSRTIKVSNKTIAMTNTLPKTTIYLFHARDKIDGKDCPANTRALQGTFTASRKRIARTLQNPRLLQIHFHTLRHWKGTMEYHKTRDILHVKQLLGHKRIENTEIYTHLVNFESDDYHSATAKTVDEARQLIETGFEYVCDMESVKLFRKRK